MMRAAVHPGPVLPDPAPRPFHPEKDVSGSRLCFAVVGQIAACVAAGRFLRHSAWGHFLFFLRRQPLELSSS